MTQELDLLLVNPGNQAQAYGSLDESLSGIELPFWRRLIAGFIRKHGYSVKIIDAETESWSSEYNAERIAQYDPFLAALFLKFYAITKKIYV